MRRSRVETHHPSTHERVSRLGQRAGVHAPWSEQGPRHPRLHGGHGPKPRDGQPCCRCLDMCRAAVRRRMARQRRPLRNRGVRPRRRTGTTLRVLTCMDALRRGRARASLALLLTGPRHGACGHDTAELGRQGPGATSRSAYRITSPPVTGRSQAPPRPGSGRGPRGRPGRARPPPPRACRPAGPRFARRRWPRVRPDA